MSNLLRQTRPAKSGDDAGVALGSEPVAGTARQLGRTTIDSTGSKTAQIKAKLTVVLSTLGTQGEIPVERSRTGAANPPAPRSSASDVLRVLDAYAADPLRLSA